MISFVFIYFSILVHVISNVHSQESTGDVLGPSGCDIDTTLYTTCGTPDIPIESLPKDCSSYLYCCIEIGNHTIIDVRQSEQSTQGYLDALIQTNTSVIIYFSYHSSSDWCAAIQPNNTAGQTEDINSLKKFLDEHKGIKGIIFGHLLQNDPPVECPDFSQNLKCYIGLMKKTITDMPIGIVVGAEEIDNYQSPKLAWLDISVLDPYVDFFIVSPLNVNQCSDAFLKTGVYPLTGNDHYTVDKIRTLIENAGIPSFRIHYRFSINPEILMNITMDYCEVYSMSYCKNVEDAKTTTCADTIQTLVEKGAYAKKHGAGFLISNIDNDDTSCICQCGQSYPAFNALLSGFTGTPAPPPCPLFDRT